MQDCACGPCRDNFAVHRELFPDVQLNFPVQLCRELLGKRLNLVVDLDACIAAERRIGRNSLFKSLLPGNLR